MVNRWMKAVIALSLMSGIAWAEPTIGKPALAFSGHGSDGKTYNLADFQGKFVVLQWYNPRCPFVRKHYDSGNMQKLQEQYAAKGVVWFEIDSNAPGKEGYMVAKEAQVMREREKTKSLATLLDPDQKIASLYEAKTTPHMFVIDPKGVLIYKGAIDDHNSADPADIPKSTNYVAQALDQAMAGKKVSTPSTAPYGCSVKYK
jgi:peroxiredoxin